MAEACRIKASWSRRARPPSCREGTAGHGRNAGAPERGLPARLLVACVMAALLLAAPLPARAWSGGEILAIQTDLAALAERAAALTGPDAPVAALVAASGLVTAPAPALPLPAAAQPAGAPTFQAMNARIALTMLSQGYGQRENSVVLIAQPEGQRALAVMSGRATPSNLRAALAAEGVQPPDGAADLTLRVPLIVMPGASLTLSPGETLRLDRSAGAFIANFGRLEVTGATIAGTTDPNPHARSFAPFVATAQAGSVMLSGARISGLGFGRTAKFSGFGVLLSALRLPGQHVQISGTVFSDLRSVMLSGTDDAVVTGNLFTAMRGPALVMSRGARARVDGNIFTAPMATNAIVIDDGALGARVTGNLVLGGERAGIVVRNDSHGATVDGNVVWNRGGGGITVAKSDCGLVTRNLVVGNEQKGIEIRTSDGSRVLGNRLFGNQSTGLWVSAQQEGAVAVLQDNVLAENATGLASASGAGIWLQGNDFTAQHLRFLGGDLAPQSPVLATNMDGRVPMLLTASGGQAQAGPPPDRCGS